METYSIQSNQSVYQPYQTQANTKDSTDSTADRSVKSDTVQISDRAKKLAGENAQNLPLEAFSLPDWFMDLSPDAVKLDTRVGAKYSESNSARYDALSNDEKKDLFEYQGTLNKYFREGLRQQGIESPADYYQNIVQNQEVSEELHQRVREKMATDSRAMELMEQFGIKLR